MVCTEQVQENVRYVRYFFSENVRYCTVFLLSVYGTMYGICVKPPCPPCIWPDPDPYQETLMWIRVAPKTNQNHGINKLKWFVNVLCIYILHNLA